MARRGCLLVAAGIAGALLLLVLIVGLYVRGTYNGLIERQQEVDTQWAQVEAQYQRRFDLIPNLVQSVQGIFNQEQSVFGQLAEARTRYAGAGTANEQVAATQQLDSALARLLVVVENYPELRSQANVTQLMDELAGTENRISVERGRYNERVRDYNNMVRRFPSNVLAGAFGFESRTLYQAVPGADQSPPVVFPTPSR
jgi:LemA protein